jgi:hypothetical protein
VAPDSDSRGLKLARFIPFVTFVTFVTFCSRHFHAPPESEDYVLRAGRLSVSVSFRSFRGQSSSMTAWASQSPSKQTNTLEQKDVKIAKKSKAGNYFRRFQYVFQRRRKQPLESLSALSLFAIFATFCSNAFSGSTRIPGSPYLIQRLPLATGFLLSADCGIPIKWT